MRDAIRWAVKNIAGVNVMVAIVLVSGLVSFLMMRRETFPEFQLEIIVVSVPYPGATPDEVESGISQKIEESLQPISGIKKLTSVCRESGGYTLAELDPSVPDVQKVLSEIRSAVDRVSVFFPERSEKSTVEQITFRLPSIRVAVVGPEDDSPEAERRLRDYAETIRDRLIDLPSVSQANLLNVKPYQIDVEVDEETLRRYGLSLKTIADLLRKENIELPGGQLRSDGQEILLRGKNKRETGDDIAKLPIISQANGTVLTVGEIGNVNDFFEDTTAINRINGKPAIVIEMARTSDEDLLNISDEVRAFAKQVEPPYGFSVFAWGDESVDVRDRIRMLRENGLQGGIIVFLLLAVFLDLRLAFWVAMGIPISLMGAGVVLFSMGATLNMLSMFAFLMAVGIVVDDGIVVGENIYSHRLMGKSHLQASIDGAIEVLPSVFSSVATTIIAFMPLFYVSGVMGKFIAVMPLAIVAMLLFSLAESTFALPGHLSHEVHPPKTILQKIGHVRNVIVNGISLPFEWVGKPANHFLDRFGETVYGPLLKLFLRYPPLPVSLAVLAILIAAGLVRSGTVPFDSFPALDGKTILGQVVFPDGTPARVTMEAANRLERSIREISQEIADREAAAGTSITPDPEDPSFPRGPAKLTSLQLGSALTGNPGAADRLSGSHVAQVQVELHDGTLRNVTSTEVINAWRARAGDFPGAERVTFQNTSIAPGGRPLEFKILAPRGNVADLEAAVEEAKQELSQQRGVYDVRDDSTPGKTEFQFSILERAKSLGITVSDLSETVRNAYYGAEVMRLQRGRHEVKLMVRYPKEQRRSISDFNEIRIRLQDGTELPITEVAQITKTKGYSEINRLDQMRSITVNAELDTAIANASVVAQGLKENFIPKMLLKYPSLRFRWEGQQQETMESFGSLGIGFGLAMACMFLLLVFEFNSYLQPLIILTIVPFGIVGAIFGHAVMQLPLTLFSMFGMVALAGVVVNDSIVLVDFINQTIRSGVPVMEALQIAGSRRLRAVFLTSVTTVAGLFPMLLEKSFQAQVLIPMATSLAFGLIASTALVLLMVPFLYWVYAKLAFTEDQFRGIWEADPT